MTKSCKYFFAENPIICVSDISYGSGKWKTTCNKKPFEWGNIEFWITNKLEVSSYSSTPNFASTIFHKIYKCEAKILYFYDQIISFNNFIFLSSSVEKIYFHNVAVENEEGLIVALEKLVATCSKLKDTYFYGGKNSIITVNTVKELLKVSQFLKIERLYLFLISEEFDIETFYAYTKKNKKTRFDLCFDDSISEAYKNRLEEIIDEIIRKQLFKLACPFLWISKRLLRYNTVLINIPGLQTAKFNFLDWLSNDI